MDERTTQNNTDPQRHVSDSRVNDTSTSEPKVYQHPIAIVSSVRESFLIQPTMLPLRSTQNMTSPCLTRASLFYSTQYIPTQQFALNPQQGTFPVSVMPPLLHIQTNNVSTERPSIVQMQEPEVHKKRKSIQESESMDMDIDVTGLNQRSPVGSPEEHNFKMEEFSPPQSVAILPDESPPSTPHSSVSSPTARATLSPTSPPMLNALSPPMANELCGICGDRATGHHYGVPSCEGCKGFFKRSVQNKKAYTCRNLTKDCPMDKRHRNRCQYCRFQKCLKAGMIKEAVREDRAPGGRHKSSLAHIKVKDDQQPPCKMPRKRLSMLSPSKNPEPSAAPPTSPLPDIIEQIIHCDSDNAIKDDNCLACKEIELKEKTLAHVTQLAEQQLVRSTLWFEKLPLLLDISTSDKTTLIRNCWVELMLANLIKNSQFLEDKAMLCTRQVLDYQTAETTGIGDIMQRVVQMASKFREFRLDHVEFVCMKIIVLLNPDVVGLENQHLIEQLQDKFHTALQNYINTNFPKETNRFGNILLRLPELRSIGTKSIERLFMLKLTGQIHTSDSLSELLHSAKR